MIKRLILFAVLILLTGLGVAQAQESPPVALWASVWLYESDIGKFTVLSTQGTPVLPETFPVIPTNYDVKPPEIAVAPDGVSVAFALSNSKTGKQALFELSRSESKPHLYELPEKNQLSPRIVFHNTSAIREVGTAAYNPIFGMTLWMQMTANPDPTLAFGSVTDDDSWSIAIYDPLNEKILHKLTRIEAQDLNPELDWPASASLILQTYYDDIVVFSLIDKQSGKLTSFSWLTLGHHIQSNLAYRARPKDLDSLPSTGEVVAVDGDTLYVYDPKLNESFAFYRAPGETLRLPRFVENGKRVAVVVNGSIRVMNRDGSEAVTAGPPAESVIDMAGVPSGLVFLSAFEDFTALGHFSLIDENISASGAVLWSTPKRVSAQIALTQSGALIPSSFDTPWTKLDSSS